MLSASIHARCDAQCSGESNLGQALFQLPESVQHKVVTTGNPIMRIWAALSMRECLLHLDLRASCENQGKVKARVFLLAETLKSLEKKEKCTKKAREIGQ